MIRFPRARNCLKLTAKQSLLLLLLITCIFTVDFISKRMTHLYLPHMNASNFHYPYGGIPVFKDFLGIEFSICHNTNKGAAWGAFSQMQTLLLLFRIGLVSSLGLFLLFFNQKKSMILPLVLVFTGALGNIVDYFVYGHVVDMFHFVLWGYDFPVFNVADTAIFLGVAWLCMIQLYAPDSSSSTSDTQ